jgi:hypothetical protein
MASFPATAGAGKYTRLRLYHSEKKGDSVKKYKRDRAGRRFRYEQQLPEKMESLTSDMTIMFDWLMKKGYAIDFDGLKREFPRMS